MAEIKIYGVLTSGTGSGELARAAQITVTGIPLGTTVQEVLEVLAANAFDLPEGVVIDPDYVHTDNNYTDGDKSTVVTMQTDYQSLVDAVNALQGSLITLNPVTNRVNHFNAYQVVLDSMGEELDGEVISHGNAGEFYYENGSLWYFDGNASYNVGNPSRALIYCNKITNKQYRWSGSTWIQVGSNIQVDASMIENSTNPVQSKVIKGYVDGLITSVQGALNELIGGENVFGAIDTFNEVVAFLDNISSSDTLAAKLLLKANAADVYSKNDVDTALAGKVATSDIANNLTTTESGKVLDARQGKELNDALAGKQATLTFDNAPTSGSNNPVKSGGIYTALQNLLSNITVDSVTGNWKVGNTDTGVKARGVDGVASGDDVVVVHDLEGEPLDLEQGQVAVLGADMGETIAGMIEEIETSGGGLSAAFVGEKLVITNAADLAHIRLSKSSLTFPQTEENDTNTKTFVVTGKNLSSGIVLSLIDSSGMFSISQNSIAAADANSPTTITVTYAPTVVGTHTARITLTSDNITSEVTLQGTAVEEVVPILLVNDGQTINIGAEDGDTATMQVPIVGYNLGANESVAIAITSGIGMTIDKQTITADENGEIDTTLTLTYVADTSDVSGTLTATSTSVGTVTVSVAGKVKTRLAAGSYWIDGYFKFTVLTNTQNVSVRKSGSTALPSELVIPGTTSDAGKSVFDSNGDPIDASEMTYNVTSVGSSSDSTGAFEGTGGMTKVTVSEGIKYLGPRVFFSGSNSSNGHIRTILLPTSLVSILGLSSNGWSWGFRNQPINKIVFGGGTNWAYFIGAFSQCTWLEFGEGITSLNTANIITSLPESVKIICRKATPPDLNANFLAFETGVTKSNVNVYVPDESVSAYQAKANWNAFNILGLSNLEE